DRLVIAESGVREPGTIARWRAQDFDAALVGEALVRAGDPTSAARAFVAAGAAPDDPANAARRPLVKICGVTDEAGVLAAIAAGADAIGLNVVEGTPRALGLDEVGALARLARSAGVRGGRRPTVVAVTADPTPERLAAILRAIDPDVVQLSGAEPPARVAEAAAARRSWKVVHIPAEEPGDATLAAGEHVAAARRFLDAGAERIMLDTAGGPHPGGTG